jgi:hypothetical protein
VPKLVCNEYCFLAYDLFRQWNPKQSDTSGTTVVMAGWDRGVVGNHAQLLVTGVGVPMLLDPTTGLIAITSYLSLRRGVGIPAGRIVDLSVRVETSAYLQLSLSRGRARVRSALNQGLYPRSVSLYTLNLDTSFP